MSPGVEMNEGSDIQRLECAIPPHHKSNGGRQRPFHLGHTAWAPKGRKVKEALRAQSRPKVQNNAVTESRESFLCSSNICYRRMRESKNTCINHDDKLSLSSPRAKRAWASRPVCPRLPPIGPSGLDSWSPHTLTWYRAPSESPGGQKGLFGPDP